MIHFTRGNLFDANVEALVNTVNTVGVMGKGIALMFKQRYPNSAQAYTSACKGGHLEVGQVLLTPSGELVGPRWIIHFPTKKHWRHPSDLAWIQDGLDDLRQVVSLQGIRSIAIPPLGCGNGKLDWSVVRPEIESRLGNLEGVDVIVFEPTDTYYNEPKARGVEELTPARALVFELIRRYCSLGIDCALIEAQKLAWFLSRSCEELGVPDPLDLRFQAHRYGPYADGLRHLLDGLDGSYLHCERRLADARPLDILWIEHERRATVAEYLSSDPMTPYGPAMEHMAARISGFESPLGMEALATVDWLLQREDCEPTLPAVRNALQSWPGGPDAGSRKLRIFEDGLVERALARLDDRR